MKLIWASDIHRPRVGYSSAVKTLTKDITHACGDSTVKGNADIHTQCCIFYVCWTVTCQPRLCRKTISHLHRSKACILQCNCCLYGHPSSIPKPASRLPNQKLQSKVQTTNYRPTMFQSSSSWHLCVRETPYALLLVFLKFPQCCLGDSFNVGMSGHGWIHHYTPPPHFFFGGEGGVCWFVCLFLPSTSLWGFNLKQDASICYNISFIHTQAQS